MTNEVVYRKRILWLALAALSPIFAFSPLIVGMIGAAFVPNCNESNCAFGVLGWFMFLTIPAGFVLFFVSLILFLTSLRHKISKAEAPTIRERKLKRYYFAWLAAALSPFVILVGVAIFLTGPTESYFNEAGGGTTLPDPEYMIVLFIGAALFVLSWLYLIAVAIWNRVKK